MKIEFIIRIVELIQKFNIYHILYFGAIVLILYLGYSGWINLNIKRDKAKIELEHDRKMKVILYLESYRERAP